MPVKESSEAALWPAGPLSSLVDEAPPAFLVRTFEDAARVPAQEAGELKPANVSALVVTYNSAATLRECLDHLKGVDVVVVDNCSTDDSVKIARSYPGVQVVESPQNVGLARALNLGASHRPGRDLLIINPDVSLTAATLDRLVYRLGTDPSLGVVAPQLVGVAGVHQPTARSFPTVATILARRSRWLHKHRRVAAAIERHLNVADGRAFWLLGACLLVRREAWDEIGGMNEDYFLYFEDVDLSYRMNAKGWCIDLVDDVTAVHLYARASKKTYALWRPTVRYHWCSAIRWFMRHPGLVLKEPLRAAWQAPAGSPTID